MATTNRTVASTEDRNSGGNSVAKQLLDSTEFREKAEKAVSELAHNLMDTANKQGKIAKKQARQLYRQSSATIKRHPWETIGAAVLTGIFIGALFAVSRHRE